MLRLQGMPYLPGAVQGALQKGLGGDFRLSIAVLGQQDLPLHGPPPLGIIVVGGAPFSHPMLRLRALGVPIVLLDPEAARVLPYGETVMLDGGSGVVSTEIAQTTPIEPSSPSRGAAPRTSDGTSIELCASIGSASGAAAALAKGAAAIGLLRSEYLFPPSGEQPNSAFLRAALREVCEAARPLSVTVRLLDIAGDKRPPWIGEVPGMGGVLGLQGARLYGIEPVRSVLHAELDALAALAGQCELRVLIPYLTQIEELERWRREISARLPAPLPVGAMLETPAATLAVANWLEAADFVALGCNDLMQCLFAADRDQPELAHLLDPYCPTLYRFLRQVAHEAGAASKSILVCGLLAQLPGVLPLLLGLGYRRFSVDPVMIPWLAQSIRTSSLADAMARAEAACGARHSREVRELLGL